MGPCRERLCVVRGRRVYDQSFRLDLALVRIDLDVSRRTALVRGHVCIKIGLEAEIPGDFRVPSFIPRRVPQDGTLPRSYPCGTPRAR